MCDDLWDSMPKDVNARGIHIQRETPHVHGNLYMYPKQTKPNSSGNPQNEK